jgi:hypothetical protein
MVPLSLIRAAFYLITFRLRFPTTHIHESVRMEDGLRFEIIRHMKLRGEPDPEVGSILIVRFKFRRFSRAANIRLSRIPIPLIAGFPGFRDKLWMIDRETGYWQGVYQFDSVASIEGYKGSFVLGIMNKRAIESTVSYETLPGLDIEDFLAGTAVA